MAYIVRPARPGDGRRIEQIRVAGWHAAYASILDPEWLAGVHVTDERIETWEQRIAAPLAGSVTIVAADAGSVAGFAALVPSRDDDVSEASELAALYVDPMVNRTGCGSALLTAGFAEMPLPLQTLWVLAGNTPARAFYERHEFVVDGGEKRLGAPGEPLEVRYRRARLT